MCHGSSASSAAPRSSAPISASLVLAVRKGASHAAAVRASAASLRSGHSSVSGRAQEADTVAQLELRLAPRQAAHAELGDALGQQARGLLARRHGTRGRGKDDGVEPAHTTRPQRGCTRVEVDLVRLADAPAGGGNNIRLVGRGRKQDARRRRRPRQLRSDQERRSRQGMRRVQVGAAAVGQQELTGRAARLADALRKRSASSCAIDISPPCPCAEHLRSPSRQPQRPPA